MNISGQDIIITGAASGIGLAMTRHLASLDARVWAIDRERALLDQAVADSRESTSAIRWVQCDVGDERQVIETVASIEEESTGIDVLVNNAAVLRDQTLVSKLGRRIKKHALADWEETLRSNLTGTFLMGREVAEAMVRAKRPGVIVNFSSVSRAGNPGQSAYAATKAAVDALTVTWSQELAVYRIRVAAIAPGFVETGMTQAIPELFLDRIREKTPLKRFGTLDEFSHTIQYVIENDYVNGRTLEVDGGLRF